MRFMGDSFDDGASPDWFVYEDPSTLMLYDEDGRLVQPSAAHWEALVGLPGSLLVPTSRDQDSEPFPVRVPGRTFRDLIVAVHQFYTSPVGTGEYVPDDCDYCVDAAARMRAGETVLRFELLGSRGVVPMDEGQRRHPFACTGLVRFEGVYRDALALGS